MTDIPINPVTRRVQFTGNTGTGPFAFTFNIFVSSDIAVYKNSTLLTLTTDYTVTIAGDGTGSVTLTGSGSGTPVILADVITIVGARDLSRTTDFVTAGDLRAITLNEQLDSGVIMAQQLDEKSDRALKFDQFDVYGDATLPVKASRLGTVLGFNATTGNPEAGPTIADVSTLAAITADIATLADIQDGTVATDAITNVNTIRANVTTVAGISANVTTVAGISADVTTVAADGTDIGIVSGISADVTTVAGISSNVTIVAADGTDIGLVAGDISNVNTVATNILSVNNFSAQYRVGATDPAGSLDEGDLFFNTTSNIMKVYDGSAWVAAYASLSGALVAANNLSDLDSNATARTNLGLATVAATGAYADVTGTPTLATVATTGAYADVTGTPAAALPLTGGTLSGTLSTPALNIGGTEVISNSRVLSNVTGLKTVNGNALLGSGDIAASTSTAINGVGTYTIGVDTGMDSTASSGTIAYKAGRTAAGSVIQGRAVLVGFSVDTTSGTTTSTSGTNIGLTSGGSPGGYRPGGPIIDNNVYSGTWRLMSPGVRYSGQSSVSSWGCPMAGLWVRYV